MDGTKCVTVSMKDMTQQITRRRKQWVNGKVLFKARKFQGQ
jgi:hypothetical protein